MEHVQYVSFKLSLELYIVYTLSNFTAHCLFFFKKHFLDFLGDVFRN